MEEINTTGTGEYDYYGGGVVVVEEIRTLSLPTPIFIGAKKGDLGQRFF